MLGLFITLRLMYRTSIMGHVSQIVGTWKGSGDTLIQRERLRRLEGDQYLDLNRARENWESERYGKEVEVIVPFRIDPEDLPHPEALHWAVGEYAFKLSEWINLWNWIETKKPNTTSKTGIDGHWLLEVGRRRWADKTTRAEALRNAKLAQEKTPP